MIVMRASCDKVEDFMEKKFWKIRDLSCCWKFVEALSLSSSF